MFENKRHVTRTFVLRFYHHAGEMPAAGHQPRFLSLVSLCSFRRGCCRDDAMAAVCRRSLAAEAMLWRRAVRPCGGCGDEISKEPKRTSCFLRGSFANFYFGDSRYGARQISCFGRVKLEMGNPRPFYDDVLFTASSLVRASLALTFFARPSQHLHVRTRTRYR